MSYSLSLQRELPYGIFAEASYVANLGRHLIRQPDINQPTFEQIRANALGANVNINALRPFKGYTAIRMRLAMRRRIITACSSTQRNGRATC